MTLNEFNQLDTLAAANALRQCCVSEAWVVRMLGARPFEYEHELYATAEACWQGLDRADYLQAFEGHPKIGDVGSLRAKYANTKVLAAGEQAAVSDADEQTLRALAEGNTAYEARFGYIFIVCATGKSAEEMLSLLNARLSNSPDDELAIAAAEQNKITLIRLQKMLST
ncbi:2-oxo-4-hydroxy-4-carboxy-5-ureidoimidazoline decarboxylase [Nitrincola tibetensis]|uniref:2-oxo-4-hydroxy-4-carboxy-5-ureidoimidazoline decarboxylase n=1 Tax=Nitrincola tibetensis TaxID=2219697 RepID=A0A364NP91_9GAMM|nr:2-oxo-4-hydroxy-4-carboxy-5-ureidoimidazoline decarboxylase [Nitrincola tibetensis]RAU18864.1 2-oxo-4-hydroxy-4-carboxy-5-ureidoimidazoline decarboxylase [Nitrincola tibetensis]